MATLKLVKNGAKAANPRRRKSSKRKRRNPSTTAISKSRNPRVMASVANPRKRRKTTRRRRRNGVMMRKNGLFGDTKETTRSVISLLAGLGVTKVESGILSPTVARALATVGMQNFAQPLTEAAMAVTVNKWAATQLAGRESGKFVMIGGLAMALMSAIQTLLPQTSTYNPFASVNVAPIVLNQPSLDSGTVKAIANAAAKDTAAKVSGAIDKLSANNLATGSPYNSNSGVRARFRQTY